MKVVCAWCGKVLKEGALADDMELNLVSHGICTDCEDTVKKQEVSE
jgi:hypothetical protein